MFHLWRTTNALQILKIAIIWCINTHINNIVYCKSMIATWTLFLCYINQRKYNIYVMGVLLGTGTIHLQKPITHLFFVLYNIAQKARAEWITRLVTITTLISVLSWIVFSMCIFIFPVNKLPKYQRWKTGEFFGGKVARNLVHTENWTAQTPLKTG